MRPIGHFLNLDCFSKGKFLTPDQFNKMVSDYDLEVLEKAELLSVIEKHKEILGQNAELLLEKGENPDEGLSPDVYNEFFETSVMLNSITLFPVLEGGVVIQKAVRSLESIEKAENEFLEKGKGGPGMWGDPEGTIKEWKGIKYQKVGKKWVPYKGGGEKTEKEGPYGDDTQFSLHKIMSIEDVIKKPTKGGKVTYEVFVKKNRDKSQVMEFVQEMYPKGDFAESSTGFTMTFDEKDANQKYDSQAQRKPKITKDSIKTWTDEPLVRWYADDSETSEEEADVLGEELESRGLLGSNGKFTYKEHSNLAMAVQNGKFEHGIDAFEPFKPKKKNEEKPKKELGYRENSDGSREYTSKNGTIKWSPGKDIKKSEELDEFFSINPFETNTEDIVKSHVWEAFDSADNFISKTGKEIKEKIVGIIEEEQTEATKQLTELTQYKTQLPLEPTEEVYEYTFRGVKSSITDIPKLFGYDTFTYGEDKLVESPTTLLNSGAGESEKKQEVKQGKFTSEQTKLAQKYNRCVKKYVDSQVEIVKLNTLLNNLDDNRNYKLTVHQASLLKF